MKALSIWQPWAWLIANGHKTIENRNWSTRFRGTFLIHASLTYDKNVTQSHFEAWGLDVAYHTYPNPNYPSDFTKGGIVGIATLRDVVTSSESPWFRGKYGFTLINARPLPFIRLQGARNFFDVPQQVVNDLYLGHHITWEEKQPQQARQPGQAERRAARAVANHPHLFGTSDTDEQQSETSKGEPPNGRRA